MYYRDYTFTMTAASTLTEQASLTITTGDTSVEGSDSFTFDFSTSSAPELLVI